MTEGGTSNKEKNMIKTFKEGKIRRCCRNPKNVRSYEETLTDVARHIKNFDIPKAELKDELEGVKSKVIRLTDKWLAVKREIEGREKGYFIRTPVGTNYYIDLDGDNGKGAGTVHDGLKEANDLAEAGTDNTHTYVTQGTLANNGDDEYNGDWIYNVTRGLGAKITDYDADDGAGSSILIHDAIVGNVATDTFYIIRAYNTLTEYTTTSVRAAGDNGYVRANTTVAWCNFI